MVSIQDDSEDTIENLYEEGNDIDCAKKVEGWQVLYHFIQFGRHASQASSDCLKCHKCLLSHSPCLKALAGAYAKYGRLHFGIGWAVG